MRIGSPDMGIYNRLYNSMKNSRASHSLYNTFNKLSVTHANKKSAASLPITIAAPRTENLKPIAKTRPSESAKPAPVLTPTEIIVKESLARQREGGYDTGWQWEALVRPEKIDNLRGNLPYIEPKLKEDKPLGIPETVEAIRSEEVKLLGFPEEIVVKMPEITDTGITEVKGLPPFFPRDPYQSPDWSPIHTALNVEI
jgi:hypothetical protein